MKKTLYYLTIFFTFLWAQAVSAQKDVHQYADYLKTHSTDPVEYMLSKLKDYRITAIGEDHWIADHTPFLCEVLKEAAKNDATRPNVVDLEFGNEIDQKTADDVAFSNSFLSDSVIKILQHTPDIYGNPYKEYFDVFKCIWRINQTLPSNKKIRIRLLDPESTQKSLNNTGIQTNQDLSMFEKIRKDFIDAIKLYSMPVQLTLEDKLLAQNTGGKILYQLSECRLSHKSDLSKRCVHH